MQKRKVKLWQCSVEAQGEFIHILRLQVNAQHVERHAILEINVGL